MQPDQTNILTAQRMKTRPSVFICAPSVGKYHRRSAFTMLEIMVVLAISIVLVSMLVVGFKYVVQSSNANSTKAAFESLKAMQANFEKSTNGTNSSMVIPTAAMIGADQAVIVPGATTPGINVLTTDSAGRYGPVVTYTQAIMLRLRSIPDNLTIIQNMASNRLYLPPLPTSSSPWVSSWVANKAYYAADTVLDQGNNVYVCIQDHYSVSGNRGNEPGPAYGANPTGYGASYWTPVSQLANIPVFLDAWGNPILFMPAGGLLTNVASPIPYTAWAASSTVPYQVNAPVSCNVNGAVQNFICIQAHFPSSSPYNGPPNSYLWKSAISPTNYRPFWVSAGPDGNFQTTADNMNSFDN